jgi:multiple sugar transport system ATP-binding protein
MAEIVLENLSKHYGKVNALNDVSLKIENGESVVLLGPSGCGKTTLLRCIAGLEIATKGNIMIDGKSVNNVPARERDLSLVFQNYALFPLMTAFGNIAFPLKIRGVSQTEIESKVHDTAKLLQIENLLQKYPRELSGGEQQRVAIGRAIAREPKAFLMDEPLSNLDSPTRIQMRTELKRIQKDLGITTIYVTHDQSEAMVLGDHIGIMNMGMIAQFDTPDNVYSNPSNIFAASFIGNPPTNLSDMTLQQNGGYYLEGMGTKFSISDEFSSKIKGKTSSKELVLGFRSEDAQISRTLIPASHSPIIEGRVELIETFGGFEFVDVRVVGGNMFKISASRDFGVNVGEKVWIKLNRDRMHIFDKSTSQLVA